MASQGSQRKGQACTGAGVPVALTGCDSKRVACIHEGSSAADRKAQPERRQVPQLRALCLGFLGPHVGQVADMLREGLHLPAVIKAVLFSIAKYEAPTCRLSDRTVSNQCCIGRIPKTSSEGLPL